MVRMAVQVFRRAVHHHVDAQLDRPLQWRRAKSRVHHADRAGAPARQSDRFDVDDAQRGIRRRLEHAQPGRTIRHFRGDAIGLDGSQPHPESGEHVPEQLVRPAVERGGGDHFVSRRDQPEKRGGHRAHSAAEGDGGFRSRKARERLLRGVDRGVLVARIHEEAAVATRVREDLRRALETEGGGLDDRHRQRGVSRLVGAGVDGKRRGAWARVRHGALVTGAVRRGYAGRKTPPGGIARGRQKEKRNRFSRGGGGYQTPAARSAPPHKMCTACASASTRELPRG